MTEDELMAALDRREAKMEAEETQRDKALITDEDRRFTAMVIGIAEGMVPYVKESQ